MKTLVKQLPLLALAALFILPACKKYEDGPGISFRTKKGRLVGEWQLDELEIDGADYTSDVNTWDLDFDKEGDFSMTFQAEGFESNSYDGEWDFSNDKEELEIKYDDGDKIEADIKRLTNKELWFEFTETYDDGSSEKWDCKFEKK